MADNKAAEIHEVIVVGAGVQGSATAYYLTKKVGLKGVLLLEQFGAQNVRGSSNGCSRLSKRAYASELYVKMMDEAFKMWQTLEEENHTQLHIKTGVLIFGPSNNPKIKEVKESVITNNLPHQLWSGKEANSQYSTQLCVPDDFTCVLDESGGVLLAAKCIQAFQNIFVEAGGQIIEECQVTEVIPGDVITVKTSKGSFQTKRLVLTVGPWAPKVLQPLGVDLPFKVVRVESLYWNVEEPKDYSTENFPPLIGYGNESDLHFYGTPVHEYPGLLKICFHGGVEVDPDNRDYGQPFNTVKPTSEFVTKYFKGISSTPSIMEPCLLTKTPDYHPVLDRHPDHPNIVIGAGFSGHGFKWAPVVGKILSELLLGVTLSYDLSIFKISKWKS